MLLSLCAATLALAAAPADFTDAAPSPSHQSPVAVHVTLASVPLSGSALGIGGLGVLGADSPTPRAGLTAELRVASHWTVTLAAEVGFGTSALGLSAQQTLVGTSPGVRWYARDAFDGPFLGLEVPLSWSQLNSSFVDANGATQSSSFSTLGVGAAALAGWVFAWDNGLLVSLAGGPAASLRRASASGLSQLSTASVGLRLQLGVGLRF